MRRRLFAQGFLDHLAKGSSRGVTPQVVRHEEWMPIAVECRFNSDLHSLIVANLQMNNHQFNCNLPVLREVHTIFRKRIVFEHGLELCVVSN
jgi:hypothetical protein